MARKKRLTKTNKNTIKKKQTETGKDNTRACLKNHSYHLHAPLCVIFAPNSGCIAHYAPFIWHKSPTNCDAHRAESIFQTRSKKPAETANRTYKDSLFTDLFYSDVTAEENLRSLYNALHPEEVLTEQDVIEKKRLVI